MRPTTSSVNFCSSGNVKPLSLTIAEGIKSDQPIARGLTGYVSGNEKQQLSTNFYPVNSVSNVNNKQKNKNQKNKNNNNNNNNNNMNNRYNNHINNNYNNEEYSIPQLLFSAESQPASHNEMVVYQFLQHTAGRNLTVAKNLEFQYTEAKIHAHELEMCIKDKNCDNDSLKEAARKVHQDSKDMDFEASRVVNGQIDEEINAIGRTLKSKGSKKVDRAGAAEIKAAKRYEYEKEHKFDKQAINQDMKERYEKTGLKTHVGEEEGYVREKEPKSVIQITRFTEWFNIYCRKMYHEDFVERSFKRYVDDIIEIMDNDRCLWHQWVRSKIDWYRIGFVNAFTDCNLVKSKLNANQDYDVTIDNEYTTRHTLKTSVFIPEKESIRALCKWMENFNDHFAEGKVPSVVEMSTFIAQVMCCTLVRISCGSMNTSAFVEVFKLQARLKYLECILFSSFLISNIPMLHIYLQTIKYTTDILNTLISHEFAFTAVHSGIQLEHVLTVAVSLVHVFKAAKFNLKFEDIFVVINELFLGKVMDNDSVVWVVPIDEQVKLEAVCTHLKINKYGYVRDFVNEFKWVGALAHLNNRSESRHRNVIVTSLLSLVLLDGRLNPEYRKAMPFGDEYLFEFPHSKYFEKIILYVSKNMHLYENQIETIVSPKFDEVEKIMLTTFEYLDTLTEIDSNNNAVLVKKDAVFVLTDGVAEVQQYRLTDYAKTSKLFDEMDDHWYDD